MIKKILLSSLVLLGYAASAHAEAQKPNVILIMADDVSWECFTTYGGEDYTTPNLDRLAAEGIQFNHCYSQPICTPSRVKIMTGQYNFRNYTHFGYLNPKDKTFGHMMQAAGYKTAIAGKWQLNGLYHEAEGCLDNTRPLQAGFDESCLWQVTKGKRAGDGGGERFWSAPIEHNGVFMDAERTNGKYGPDVMSDFVCDFIERHQDEPFFIYYPTVLVHSPFVATPDTIGDSPRDASANKTPKAAGAKKANFVAMVHYMDKLVGKIVQQVEAVGQLENTIILFTADNGTSSGIRSQWNGQQIRGGKGSTQDMGTRVPFIAYWKGHTPNGVVLNDLIDFTDFYATFADAAGVELSADDPIDGRSFFAQLKGEPANPREWMFCNYQPYWGSFDGRQFVRDTQFKLYRNGDFFNVPNDLQEKNHLASNQTGEAGQTAHRKLNAVLESAAPAPLVKGGKNAKERPTYPTWADFVNPND